MAHKLTKKNLFLIIAIVAVGGILLFSAMPGHRRIPSGSTPQSQDNHREGPEELTPAATPETNLPDLQVILQRHLFGKPIDTNKPAPVEPPPVQLVATSLDLSLLGTITGEARYRRAIILDKKKRNQDIYGQGDTIQGSVIKEIQRDKVILTVNGKDEILIPETPKKGAVPQPPSFRPVQAPPAVQAPAEAPEAVENPESLSAEPIEPEALEPSSEPAEPMEPTEAEAVPENPSESIDKEPVPLPPVRRNQQNSSPK